MLNFYMSVFMCIFDFNNIEYFIRPKNIIFPSEDEDEVKHVFPKAKPWKK